MPAKEAMFYNKLDQGSVLCFLCPHNCKIGVGGRGLCGVRQNRGRTLYSLNYGEISSIGVDPIEKKPLYRFHPGSYILSVGSIGCNLKCPFCQNHSIARVKPEEVYTQPADSEQLIVKALSLKNQGNIGIAYTFNEPTIWYEYVYDTARLAKENGLLNVLVTNGFIGKEPLEKILPFIDAMNIDLKAYSEEFYCDFVKGRLKEVKATIARASESCHVEVTTLIIPGKNDSVSEIEAMAEWLSTISRELPLHLSRYFPRYELNLEPTSLKTLEELKKAAQKHLDYVYIGNV